jgi:3',5'-cyclic-AMP phosphodiesterase
MCRLVQISDTHLFAEPDGRLLEQPTRPPFAAVLGMLRSTLFPIDGVLLTGDLVHDASPEGYRYLNASMLALGVPYHAIPGNHDPVALLSEHLDPGAAEAVRCIVIRGWQVVLLDSPVPGEDGGRLDGPRLDRLDLALGERPEHPALVCLHHHAVTVGSPWMDEIGLADGDAFSAVLDRHPQVRGVLWGHIHQAFDVLRGRVRLMGCPSTSVQFRPNSDDIALDTASPGLRWLDLSCLSGY